MTLLVPVPCSGGLQQRPNGRCREFAPTQSNSQLFNLDIIILCRTVLVHVRVRVCTGSAHTHTHTHKLFERCYCFEWLYVFED